MAAESAVNRPIAGLLCKKGKKSNAWLVAIDKKN